jgi:serine/threonine-protein kinase
VIGIGATVGNYRVMEKIGEGAMGAVFLASHPVIGKRVALKVIHPELSANEEMLLRFFNEARAVTQIGHQNIVAVQDFGQTPEGDSFIIMELLEGRGLGDLMKQIGIFPVERALHVATQMADGLAAAHARGVIHRDLKPDNVILVPRSGDEDFVKILDFGLAKLQGPGASGMNLKTKTGSLLGTPHYMAPEQAEGKPIDHRVDVYALGCILFQMLTGRVPFPGNGFGEVLVKHIREPPPLPSRLSAQVTPAIEKIVLHALAKKPEFRFKSMEDFGLALRRPDEFARKIDAGASLHLTPGDGLPAPSIARTSLAAGPPPPAPILNGPLRLPEDAPTMMAGAAPEAEAVRAAQNDPANVHEAVTGPSKRANAPTVAERPQRPLLPPDEIPRRRSPAIVIGFLVGVAALGGLGWMWKGQASTIAVTINTTPPGVAILQGDRILATSPAVLKVSKGVAQVVLTFHKDGFVNAQRIVEPTADQELGVRLVPKPREPPPEAPPKPDARVEPPPAPVPTVAATPDPSPQPAAPKPKPKRKPKPEKGHGIEDHLLMQPTF